MINTNGNHITNIKDNRRCSDDYEINNEIALMMAMLMRLMVIILIMTKMI